MRKDFLRHDVASGMNPEVFCNTLNDMVKKGEELFFKTEEAIVFTDIIEVELEVAKSKKDTEFKLFRFESLFAKAEMLNARKFNILQELRINLETDLDYIYILKIIKEEEK